MDEGDNELGDAVGEWLQSLPERDELGDVRRRRCEGVDTFRQAKER